MAIQKPYDISVSGKTIDANEVNTVSWKSSGDTSAAFSITVYDNKDGSAIWSLPKYISYDQSYSIPAGSVENEKEYKIKITVYNKDDISATSDFEIFKTSARPTLTVPTIGEVNSPTYTFSAIYKQANDIGMKYCIAYLYDSNYNLIAQSDVLYSPPLQFIYTNLQNDKSYYIEFQAPSTKDVVGTSGKILFHVSYEQTAIGGVIYGENIENAQVQLTWKAIQILGDGENYKFIDNSKVDVKNGNVYFDKDFVINQDFIMKIWVEDPIVDKPLITLNGIGGNIILTYYNNRFHLIRNMNNRINHVATSIVKGSDYYVCIQQIMDYFNIYSEVIS